MAEIAHAAARLMLAGRQFRGKKGVGGDALSEFGGESVRNAIKSRRHLRRNREADLGVAKRLDSSGRGDKMLINETGWPAMVPGHRSSGIMSGKSLTVHDPDGHAMQLVEWGHTRTREVHRWNHCHVTPRCDAGPPPDQSRYPCRTVA